MSTHYTLTVPVEAKDGKTYFRRVGAMSVVRTLCADGCVN